MRNIEVISDSLLFAMLERVHTNQNYASPFLSRKV